MKQKNLDADAIEQILQMDGLEAWAPELARSAPTDKDPDRTLLARHVTGFTARNARDYFVHKDLGGFLRRELDFFLKNEVLQIDELVGADADEVPEPAQLERRAARARVVRRIASDVIAFLAQVEEFQKRLWLKKKFVLGDELAHHPRQRAGGSVARGRGERRSARARCRDPGRMASWLDLGQIE